MKDVDEKASQGAARALFERAVRGVDPVTAGQLRLARNTALESAHGASRRAWAPALATAALLVLGLAWWLPQREPAPVSTPTAAALVAPDVADLAVEGDDTDLYAWLGEAPVAAERDPEQQL